jgi:hypothetical protein
LSAAEACQRVQPCQTFPEASRKIDAPISALRENSELAEQAAAYSGAADDELISQRIAAQQEQLDILRKRRAELLYKDD